MAVNKRDLSTTTGETGWPLVNYAQEERNFQTTWNGRAGALSVPRFKFTFLVEFQFSPRALDNPITNLKEFVSDTGKLYTHLVSIDHPSPTFKTEKLRSYNKWINVPTQVEYPSASMTFHDDSTSVVQALWKENLNFYTYQATIGDTISGIDTQSNLGSTQEVGSFQFTDDLVAPDGGEMRSAMGRRPSLGMRLKPNDGRHFFESIKIYDLGTEPDAINVYWFHRPMINNWSHDPLDKEDRTGNVRVNASFDYEGYYFTIGQNRGRLADYIQHILGAFPEGGLNAPRKDGIARDGREGVVNRSVENVVGQGTPDLITSATRGRAEAAAAAEAARNIIEPALESELSPVIPNSLEGKQQDLDLVREEQEAIKDGRVPLNDPEGRLAELDEREAELTEEIKNQKAEQRATEFASAEEKSALENTQREAAISGESPSSTGDSPERAVIQDSWGLAMEAGDLRRDETHFRQLAETQTRLAANQQAAADRNAERGDTKKARLSQSAADRNRAKAADNTAAADAAGAAAAEKELAAKNARELNKDRASLD